MKMIQRSAHCKLIFLVCMLDLRNSSRKYNTPYHHPTTGISCESSVTGKLAVTVKDRTAVASSIFSRSP